MTASRTPSGRPWVAYTVLRLVFFAVPLVVVWAVGGNVTLAAVTAAVIGLCLSLVLLDRQRGAVARRIEARVERRRPATDEAVEDGVVDGDAPAQSSDSAAARPRP